MKLSRTAFITAAVVCLVVLSSCGDNDGAETPTETQPPAPSATSMPTPAPDGEVTIAAVGDIMLARDLTTLMEEHGATYPYERVQSLLADADITVANLEIALTERGQPVEKLYNFRTSPLFAAGLVDAGIDVVSLGNNHTADYGPDGVEDTLAALDRVGLLRAGAGMDEAQARALAVTTVNGLTIAFLSYTDQLVNTFAGPDQAGVALADSETITEDVAAAGEIADVVVVSIHSGTEYEDQPTDAQQTFAHAAIDAGALLVIGHHPHTLQGIVEYGAGLIAYSLGNFVFDLDQEDLTELGPRAFETVVLYVTVREDEIVDVRMEPVFIDPVENRPRPANDQEATEILKRLDALKELAGG